MGTKKPILQRLKEVFITQPSCEEQNHMSDHAKQDEIAAKEEAAKAAAKTPNTLVPVKNHIETPKIQDLVYHPDGQLICGFKLPLQEANPAKNLQTPITYNVSQRVPKNGHDGGVKF